MSDDYSFRSVGEVCNTCGKGLDEQERLFSALRREEEGYVRLDYCLPCWDSQDCGNFLCFWKRKPRIKEVQPTVDGAVLFDIFQRLELSKDRHDQNFRYILGLMLMRRKRLKFLDVERTEAGEFLVLEDRRFQDVKYSLLDPSMNEEEMHRAKGEVEKLFSVNLDGGRPDEAAGNTDNSDEQDGEEIVVDDGEMPEPEEAGDEQRIPEVHQS